MKSAVLSAALLALVKGHCDQAFVDQLKVLATTWTPIEPSTSVFKGMFKEELSMHLGDKSTHAAAQHLKNIKHETVSNQLTNFDAREKWPTCIHPVRDQGHCGSCWAHTTSEVFSDRLCILSGGKITTFIASP